MWRGKSRDQTPVRERFSLAIQLTTVVERSSKTSHVASANLAELRKQLGEPLVAFLDKLPFHDVAHRQVHEPKAISFMLELGSIPSRSPAKQEKVWIVLFPPTQDSQSRVHFYSWEAEPEEWVIHDGQNICAAVTDYTPAFKMSKKPSRAKCTALAKYYFLKILAIEENENGICELKYPLPVNKSFLNDLKSACSEVKDEIKVTPSSRQSRASSVTLVNTQDSDMTIDGTVLPERLQKQTPAPRESNVPIAPQVPNMVDKGVSRLQTSTQKPS